MNLRKITDDGQPTIPATQGFEVEISPEMFQRASDMCAVAASELPHGAGIADITDVAMSIMEDSLTDGEITHQDYDVMFGALLWLEHGQ